MVVLNKVFSQSVKLPLSSMGGSIPSRPTMEDSYKFFARDVPEGTIIEQVCKDYLNAFNEYDSMVYECINEAFMVIECCRRGEWEESGIGGGEWINKDEAIFEIINHGVRLDW